MLNRKNDYQRWKRWQILMQQKINICSIISKKCYSLTSKLPYFQKKNVFYVEVCIDAKTNTRQTIRNVGNLIIDLLVTTLLVIFLKLKSWLPFRLKVISTFEVKSELLLACCNTFILEIVLTQICICSLLISFNEYMVCVQVCNVLDLLVHCKGFIK